MNAPSHTAANRDYKRGFPYILPHPQAKPVIHPAVFSP